MTPTPYPPYPSQPSDAYPSQPCDRTGRPHPGLFTTGVVQLVVTGLFCLVYAFIGIGVAMCSDGGSRSYCGQVDHHYSFAGWMILLNLTVGVLTLVVVGKPRRTATCRTLAAVVAASSGLLAVAAALLCTFTSGPVR